MERDPLKLTGFATLLATFLLAACETPPSASETPKATGYSLSGDAVVFQFNPWEFAYVTNGKTGVWLPITKIPRIDTVTVAGPFNGWSTELSLLTANGAGYSLSMPRTALEAFGPLVPFKFVVNGVWWVEPPVVAPNSESTKLANRSSNLLLTLP